MRRRSILLLLTAMVTAMVMASGVAWAAVVWCSSDPCLGTNEADQIGGTGDVASEGETILALKGDDFVNAYDGDDAIYGGKGDDFLVGSFGNDTIYGGRGGDGEPGGRGMRALRGENDSDTVYGGRGVDYIDAAEGDRPAETATAPVDHSYGGLGNDTVYANDGNTDIVDCGKGRADTVYYDVGLDEVKNCEIENPLLAE